MMCWMQHSDCNIRTTHCRSPQHPLSLQLLCYSIRFTALMLPANLL